MAGFETIVRPAVFPNIRPVKPEQLAPQDAPDTQQVIRGNPASVASNTYSVHESYQINRNTEKERRVDVMRVYQKDDDGKITKENFVDIEVTNRMRKQGGKGPANPTGQGDSYAIAPDFTTYYAPAKEADNIERREQNVIRKS